MIDNDHDSPSCSNGPRPPAILSREQAAVYLGVSVRTFDRIQKDTAIPFVTVGKRRKYLQRDLEAYLHSRRRV